MLQIQITLKSIDVVITDEYLTEIVKFGFQSQYYGLIYLDISQQKIKFNWEFQLFGFLIRNKDEVLF